MGCTVLRFLLWALMDQYHYQLKDMTEAHRF